MLGTVADSGDRHPTWPLLFYFLQFFMESSIGDSRDEESLISSRGQCMFEYTYCQSSLYPRSYRREGDF